jgi:hypothetical protein
VPKAYARERTASLTSGAWKIGYSYVQTKIDPYILPYTKINSK